MPAEQKFPHVDPQWDNNDPEDRRNMEDLREIIILGIREAIPGLQYLIKAFEIYQGNDETPLAFLQRLRDQMRRYSGMNPDDPVTLGILEVQFVMKAWPCIQRKLEKMEDWSERPLEDLLRGAHKVYVKREEEKQKQKAKMIVSTVDQGVKQGIYPVVTQR